MEVHGGHRERLRERFLRDGLEGFAPHEALELLLFYAVPRRDTNPTAHALIRRFDSLTGVLEAPLEELKAVSGVGERTAVLLKLVAELNRKARTETTEIRLDTTERLGTYLRECYSGEYDEMVCQLCLDRKGCLLSRRWMGEGGILTANLDVRRFVETALRYSASLVVIAHNHPSGVALPSREDYAATDRLRRAMDAVGILLQDHIILAGDDYISMRESGYL